MARIYIIPSSQFVPGRLGKARRWELASIPSKLAECEAGMNANSLERWRIA